jgi:ATP-binding cassette, subfamily B, bacterial MsbA
MNDLKRLLSYVRPYWLTFVLAFMAMLLGAVFDTAIGAMLVPIFDQFLQGASSESKTLYDLNSLIPKDDWYRAWITISALLITFTLLKGVAEYFSTYLMAKIGQSAVLNLRQELYDHLLKQSAVFFERHRTSYLVSRLIVSCGAIEQAVSSNLRDVVRETVLLIFFLGAALYLNWRLAIGTLILLPIVALITSYVSKRMRKLAEVMLNSNKEINDTAWESLGNNVIVRAYGAEERERRRFFNVAHTLVKTNLRSARISAIFPTAIELISVVVIVGLIYFGQREINSARLDPAQFFTFLYFLFRSFDPIRKLSRQHTEISRAFAAATDVWEVLDENEALEEKPNAVVLDGLKDSISLRKVSFSYRNNKRPILRSIDMEIPAGAMIALVGRSGGGKSTLTKLVQRFYDPTEGAVLWDGYDLRDVSLASLRRQIALVTQETVLFNDTVRQNIAYGKPDATDEELLNAAKAAYADDFISQLPQQFDTLLGERGILISGGQRQRIAIARAVLMDAPVLILDEATSSLDTESERLVQRALANLMKGRTSIVIAHRLSTIRKADNIVVMEKGAIVEQGTHDELLSKDGIYTMLYNMQFVDADVEIDIEN